MSFVEKYRPKKIGEVLGQEAAKKEILSWLASPKKALLLHGPPGVGKTSLIEAVANEKNLDLIELNASDERTPEMIEAVLGNTIKQKSLFRKGKLILLDEIDGLASSDRGTSAIINIIKESKFPVVLTANDVYSKKLQALRSYCKLVQFKKINSLTIEKRLKQIRDIENINASDVEIKILAKMADGDLRSALNDLEAAREEGETGFRERKRNIFEVLKIIFKTRSIETARQTIAEADKNLEEIIWWLEENIPVEYENPEEIARAFEMLAKADLFRIRINRSMNYRFLVYMTDFIAAVSAAKEKPYYKFSYYKPPQTFSIFAKSKAEREKTDRVLAELAEKLHCSKRTVKNEYLPYLKIMGRI